MRRGIIGTAAVIAGVLAATGGAASAAQAATIGCANTKWTVSSPRDQPSRCIVFRGNQANHANELDLRSIRWQGWGAASVAGTGVSVYCCMGGEQRTPMKVRAYRLRTSAACGQRAYTRLAVRFGSSKPIVFKPPACRTRLTN